MKHATTKNMHIVFSKTVERTIFIMDYTFTFIFYDFSVGICIHWHWERGWGKNADKNFVCKCIIDNKKRFILLEKLCACFFVACFILS